MRFLFPVLIFFFPFFKVNGQGVGIGTPNPASSAKLEVQSSTQGFLLPRMTESQRNKILNPANGLIIFNTSSGSLNYFVNGLWHELIAVPVGAIGSLNCAGSSPSGTLTQGIAAAGVSSSVPYTGGNGGTHSGQVVNSTGVTGLTATVAAGSFANGAGNLIYNITGTPTGSGTASFALNIGGQGCTLTRTVNAPVGAIGSLNCAGSSPSGTLTQGIAAAGVSSSVPYTGGNGGTHSGQVVNSTGVTGLTATLAAGSFANGAGNLIYNITGTPTGSGTASFALNIGGQGCTLTRTVNAPVGAIGSLNCAGSSPSGTLTQGIAAAGVSSSVPYTGGNGGTHSGQVVNSTGVTGLTATLAAGSFANGAGNLVYQITGTPSSSGTASFALNIGGQGCTLTRTVNAPVGAIGSLNCAGSSPSGTLTQGIAAAGVSSSVPYTGGNGGTHSGQVVNSTGVTGLTATLAAGSFANGAGNLIYNITGTPTGSGTASFALNIGGQGCTLTRTVNAPVGAIGSLNCAGSSPSGTLTQGIAAAGVSSSVPYTGGNGGTHSGQVVNSTGVTGLTATLAAGSFANGAGNLVYQITGTPSSSGTASFALNIGGQGCTLTRTVNAPVGAIGSLNCAGSSPSGTLTQGIAAAGVSSSVPYTGGNGGTHSGQVVNSTGVTGLTATLAAGSFANGAGNLIYNITGTPTGSGTASFALNIGGQGCTLTRTVNAPVGAIGSLNCAGSSPSGTLTQGIAAAGVSSSVPYTGGNGGTHSGQVVNSTGVTGLTATLAAGSFANGAGNLVYQITGTPSSSGTASFVLNIGGQGCTLTRSVASLYPPGTVHCGGTPTAVVPVLNPVTGRIWMDRNLGASRVATSSGDAQAFGDLYQWGRRADGHQCRNSPTTTSLSNSDQPAHGNFITTVLFPSDWRNPQNNNLWQGINGVNNPCPSGYRLPTRAELEAELGTWSSSTGVGAYGSPLKLSMAGKRDVTNGNIINPSSEGHYWTSTVWVPGPGIPSTTSTFLGFYPVLIAVTSGGSRGDGRSVRCIRD
jgi:hypothetical protein